MTILNTVTNTIVYTPLVIICLTVLYGIGYGVWYYRTNNTLPPSYQNVLSIFLTILKNILYPAKLVLQFLWWLIPIDKSLFGFESWREKFGFLKYGAWDISNITRSGVVLLFSLFLTISALVYKYGYPNTIIGYSRFINYTLLILSIISVIALFIVFNKNIMNDNSWPVEGVNLDSRRRKWLATTAGKYLYYTIGTGLALGILFLIFYFMTKYSIVSLTGTTILMILSGLMAIFLLYNLLKQNTQVKNLLNQSQLFSNLFYIVFIIPCLFGDTLKFLFNQFRHTPSSAYIIIGLEMLFISLYFIVPIIKKYLYTFMFPNNNKSELIKIKINSIKNNQSILKAKINTIKSFSYRLGVKNNKNIDDNGWNTIISSNLNDINKRDELEAFLTNYGYKNFGMCKEKDDDPEKCKEI